MRQLMTSTTAAVLLAVSAAAASGSDDAKWKRLVVTDGLQASAEREAIVRALRLLPRLPVRVAVLNATDARPEVIPTLLALDAFVVTGSPVIYLVRESALFRDAVGGSTIHSYVLASVIWHELAHADGADEREARKQEELLWTSFVRDQRVDGTVALRYLQALRSRPDDQLMAAR